MFYFLPNILMTFKCTFYFQMLYLLYMLYLLSNINFTINHWIYFLMFNLLSNIQFTLSIQHKCLLKVKFITKHSIYFQMFNSSFATFGRLDLLLNGLIRSRLELFWNKKVETSDQLQIRIKLTFKSRSTRIQKIRLTSNND